MSRVRRYSRSGPTAAHRRSPTGLSPSAVTRSSGLRLNDASAARRLPPPPAHSSNPPQASPAGCAARGVWAPPRSLAATRGILSFPRGTEMFQFPRCPPEFPQVPGRAPGGLPHSDTPGSQAASASPGHFAAWPRPSSAANAKASTMRPSCGVFRSCSQSGNRRGLGSRPARASGTYPARPRACPRPPPEPRSDGPSPTPPFPSPPAVTARRQRAEPAVVIDVLIRSARGRPDTSTPLALPLPGPQQGSVTHPPKEVAVPAAAEPHGFRVAHCQRAGNDPKIVTNEVVKPLPNPRNLDVPGSRQNFPAACGHPTAAGGDEWEGDPRRTLVSQPPRWSRGDSNPGPPPCKGGALPAKLRPPVPTPAAPPARIDTAIPARVGAPGLEPGTSALSGPRSNRLSYAPAGAAVSHSSTAAGPPQDSPGSTPALCPRRSARILPRIDPSTPGRLRSNQHSIVSPVTRVASPTSPPSVAPLPGPQTVSRRDDLGARCPPMPDHHPET